MTTKTKTKKEVETRVKFILDETSSMSSCKQATISGFNEYIKTLGKDGKNILFTLIKFNSAKTQIVHSDESLTKVAQLTEENYQPDFITPLYDAIGKAVNDARDVKGKVLFVIMTDGEENASKEFNRQSIFDLIEAKKKDGWTFIFLGANQDSWQAGMSLGISKGNTINFDTNNMSNVMRGLAVSNTAFSHSVQTSSKSYFAEYGTYKNKDGTEVEATTK